MDLQTNETLLVEDPLTRNELTGFAEKIAKLIGDAESLEAQKKEYTADMNLKIKDIESQASELALIVRQGFQVRPVECEIVYDFQNRSKHYHRVDNGVIVETRKLSKEEMQHQLFEDKPE